MRLNIEGWFRDRQKARALWTPWFAWHPVEADGVVVWLEVVLRKKYSADTCWYYSLPENLAPFKADLQPAAKEGK